MFHTGWKRSFLPPRGIRLFLTDSRQASVLYWKYRKNTRGRSGGEKFEAEDRLASILNSWHGQHKRGARSAQPRAWEGRRWASSHALNRYTTAHSYVRNNFSRNCLINLLNLSRAHMNFCPAHPCTPPPSLGGPKTKSIFLVFGRLKAK